MPKSSPRKLQTHIPVRIALSSGDTVMATLIEISLAGVTIEYPARADKGTVLTLSFQLPIKMKSVPVETKAEVMGSYLNHDVFHINLRFLELTQDAGQKIETYLLYLGSLRRS